ncbi:acetyltransferase [Salegentibacter chungangensis]|uniref:Acetyltransferase n=1 Tax=Salegentibacter chungangensis TaxID=1335724 RepID=A0ABW3NRK0_9FLAO
MKKKLIIYGVGKLAQYVRYVFENDTDYDVIAYCIEEKLLESNTFDNKPLINFEQLGELYETKSVNVFIAVGNNKIRKRLFKETKEKGYSLASYISSKAQFWPDLITGENVFIGEGSVIQPFVEIGDNSYLICANIGHHSKIGNHALLSVTTLGGNTLIGDHCFLGMNSTVRHNIQVGEYSIIGMNVNIEKDANPYSVYSNGGTTLRKIDSSKLLDRILL